MAVPCDAPGHRAHTELIRLTSTAVMAHDGRHRKSSFASRSVAADGALVFVYFGAEGLYARKTSNESWRGTRASGRSRRSGSASARRPSCSRTS